MAFKLGSSRNKYNIPGKTQLFKKKLDNDVIAEANIDGTIYIDENVIPGSFEDKQIINEEMRHATDIKIGKIAYDDYSVTYNGEEFARMDIDGVDSILVDGEWKEAGDPSFPWEMDAKKGTV